MKADPLPAAEKKLPKLRWYQFSLRTLFLFVTACAIACSWFATRLDRASKQKAAVAALEQAGGFAWYQKGLRYSRPPKPPGPEWLVRTLGNDCP